MASAGRGVAAGSLTILVSLMMAIVTVVATLPGCASPPARGILESEPEVAALSSRQLGLFVTDYANMFADTVKRSAGQIEARATTLSARRAALQWKIKAVPAVYTVASHEDPLFGLADLWVLAIQQRALFSRDDMADVFGADQSIAVGAARLLEQRIEAVARRTVKSPEAFSELERFVRNFAAQHPIADLSFVRDSIAILYVDFVQEQTNLRQELAAVKDYAQTALTLALIGLNHVPEIARWQAELTLLDAETYPVIDRTLKSVDALGAVAIDLKLVAASLPADIDAQREAILRDIERQRVATLRDIENMRRAAFADFSVEREAVLAGIELQIDRVLDSVRVEREALSTQLPLVAERAGEAVMPLTREVIDHAFWRALQLLLVLFAVLLVTALVNRAVRKRTAARPGSQ